MNDTNSPLLDEDSADLFAAITNIWLALEAIRKTLPDPQERSVALALEGLAKVMSSLMRRHNITVSTDPVDQGPMP